MAPTTSNDAAFSAETSAELRRLVKRRIGVGQLCDDSPLPKTVLRDLWLVEHNDIWRGAPCGNSWVSAWLSFGALFHIEDPVACGESIGGKSEPKRRALWTWYFGSALWLEALQVDVVVVGGAASAGRQGAFAGRGGVAVSGWAYAGHGGAAAWPASAPAAAGRGAAAFAADGRGAAACPVAAKRQRQQ